MSVAVLSGTSCAGLRCTALPVGAALVVGIVIVAGLVKFGVHSCSNTRLLAFIDPSALSE